MKPILLCLLLTLFGVTPLTTAGNPDQSAPAKVILEIVPPVAHMFPSGPAVMPGKPCANEYSVIVPAESIRPSAAFFSSVNQYAPSGALAIAQG